MGLAAPLLGFIAFIVAVGIYGSFAFVEKGVERAPLFPFHAASSQIGH